jgi:hypothetical protein
MYSPSSPICAIKYVNTGPTAHSNRRGMRTSEDVNNILFMFYIFVQKIGVMLYLSPIRLHSKTG